VDHNYNLFDREENTFKKIMIFQSYLPPGDYTNLQFGITAEEMLLTYGYAFGGIRIPLDRTAETSLLQDLNTEYTISPEHVTELEIHIKISESVERYRDKYNLNPKLTVVDVRDAGTFKNKYDVKY